MSKVFIKTFGCQMNKNDSAIIAEILATAGYSTTNDINNANVCIVNTCSVREHAEQRALGYISTLKKWKSMPARILAVVGCMAMRLEKKLTTEYPYVDLIAGPDSYREIKQYINEISGNRTRIIEARLGQETYKGIIPSRRHVADYVSIMRGCDNYCSYCIVPFVRGRVRSRPVDDIIREIRQMAEAGTKDITLLGQNVNEYDCQGIDFPELLKRSADIAGVVRLRFLTSHPKDFTNAIIDTVASYEPIMEWIHLPVQSGNNRILRLMNRQYTREQYHELIQNIRKTIPGATITTDIIVGFPTETEEEFQDTISLVKEIDFDDAYMYRYSPRPGTKANRLESLPESVIKHRLQKLISLHAELISKKCHAMIGNIYEVLFEGATGTGGSRGKTRGNKDIVINRIITPGAIHKVRVTRIRGRTPIGVIVS